MRAPLFIALALTATLALPRTDAFAQTAPDAHSPDTAAQAQTAPTQSPRPKAQPLLARAEITPAQVRLGEPFTLSIEVQDRESERYELTRDFSLGPDVDVLDIQVSRVPGDDGLETTRFTLRAALFELGDKTLPTLRLVATGADGEKILELDGPSVTGLGVVSEEDEAGYADILPPVEVGVTSYLPLWILLGVLAALALIFGLVRLVRHLLNRPRKAPPPPPLAPAHTRALEALHALLEEDLASQGRERELFFRLSEIERGYIGERYGFGALDMTSGELLATLGRTHTPGLDLARFERHSQEGDLVRFAKASATAAECKRAIEEAIELVRRTAPQDEKGKALKTPATSTGAAA